MCAPSTGPLAGLVRAAVAPWGWVFVVGDVDAFWAADTGSRRIRGPQNCLSERRRGEQSLALAPGPDLVAQFGRLPAGAQVDPVEITASLPGRQMDDDAGVAGTL